MKKQVLIKAVWIIYLLAAIVFLINALSGITGYVILEDTSVGISTIFACVFVAATVLLVVYNKRLRK